MDINTIRSIIFLAIGLVLILFPEKVYKFQAYVMKKLFPKYDFKKYDKCNTYTGVIFIIIAFILLAYSILY